MDFQELRNRPLLFESRLLKSKREKFYFILDKKLYYTTYKLETDELRIFASLLITS